MARSVSFGTLKSIASVSISAPTGMTTDGFPLKESARSEPGTIAESLLRSAMCTAPIASGDAPKTLDRCTRTRLPPTLERAIMRTVWLLKLPEGGGGGAGVAGDWPAGVCAAAGGVRGGGATRGICAAAAHVTTQCNPDAEFWA